jgi:hypothetical protein
MSEVTKQDLQDAVAELKSYIEQRSEKVETNLLSAFHAWARSMEIRVRNAGSMVTGFDERLALAEDRIAELERRKPQSQA